MQPSTCLIFFVLLVLSLTSVQRVEACSCYPQHPQTAFCQSDFVAVVKIKKIVPVNTYEINYKVKINRIFKATLKADIALKQNILSSSSMGSMCGVKLDVGETYVVSGMISSGKPRVTLCGLSERWANVTSRQRKGFRRLYHYGCVCEIRYTHWLRKGAVLDEAGGKRCLWESTPGPQDCQEKHGVCMLSPSGCTWVPSVLYTNCIKEHQRQRG